MEQCRRSLVCETPTCEFSHSSANWLHSSLFLLVFFDLQARISLLGEVDWAWPVDNQRRCCAAIAGFGTCCLEAGSNCVATPPNRELSESFRRLGTLFYINDGPWTIPTAVDESACMDKRIRWHIKTCRSSTLLLVIIACTGLHQSLHRPALAYA
jgi:hypothetical protein